MLPSDTIAAAYIAACTEELQALKPGNAHVHASTHKLSVAQFMESARASAPALTQGGTSIGRRILDAVAATQAAVGTNTNLGIILLCAPLAAVAEGLTDLSIPALRGALTNALDALTVDDAAQAFRAIALAAPGGTALLSSMPMALPIFSGWASPPVRKRTRLFRPAGVIRNGARCWSI